MIVTSSWSGICSTARPQSSWDIMHKGKQLWNPAAQQEHGMFVSPDTAGYFGFWKYFRRWEPCAKSLSVTKRHPLADPGAEATHRQACRLHLAELKEHFRGALLPGAGILHRDTATLEARKLEQEQQLHRMFCTQTQSWPLPGTEAGGASQSPVMLKGQWGQEGQATAGSTVQQTLRALQQAKLSLYAPLLKKKTENQVCVTTIMHHFACKDFQHT